MTSHASQKPQESLTSNIYLNLYFSKIISKYQLTFQCFDTVGGRQEGHPACKNGGWWRWALVSADGVAPSQMVGVSASVNFPCTIKSRSSLLAPAHQGGPGKRAVKWLWWFSRCKYSYLNGHSITKRPLVEQQFKYCWYDCP